MERLGFVQISGTYFRHTTLGCEIDINEAPPDEQSFVEAIFWLGEAAGRADQKRRYRRAMGIVEQP